MTMAMGMVMKRVKAPHGFFIIANTTTMPRPAMARMMMKRMAIEVVKPVTGPTSLRAIVASD